MKKCPLCGSRFSIFPPTPHVCFSCWCEYKSMPVGWKPVPAKRTPRPFRREFAMGGVVKNDRSFIIGEQISHYA